MGGKAAQSTALLRVSHDEPYHVPHHGTQLDRFAALDPVDLVQVEVVGIVVQLVRKLRHFRHRRNDLVVRSPPDQQVIGGDAPLTGRSAATNDLVAIRTEWRRRLPRDPAQVPVLLQHLPDPLVPLLLDRRVVPRHRKVPRRR